MKQIKKLLKTYKGLVISIVMILVSVGGVFVGVIPAIGKIIQIRSDIMILSSSTDHMQSKLNILNATDETTYTSQLQDLVAAVPSDKSLTTLFSTVDGIAVSSGVTITDVSLVKPGSIATESAKKQSNEEKQIGSNLLPFTVTVNGNYSQIHSFLSQAVNVRRFFRVRNFEISLADMSDISVRMGMDAFYSPITLDPQNFDKPLEPLSSEEEQIIVQIRAMPLVGQTTLPAPSVPSAESPSGGRADPFSP
jgi:Tfp pilus assembly protein PilO